VASLKEQLVEFAKKHNLLLLKAIHDTNVWELRFRISDDSDGHISIPVDECGGILIQGGYRRYDFERFRYNQKMYMTQCEPHSENAMVMVRQMFHNIVRTKVKTNEEALPIYSFDGSSIESKCKLMKEGLRLLPSYAE